MQVPILSGEDARKLKVICGEIFYVNIESDGSGNLIYQKLI